MDPTTHSDVDHAFQSQMLTDLSTDIEAPAPPPIINSSGFHTDTVPSSVPTDPSQSMFEATAAAIAAVTAVDGAADGSATVAAVASNSTYSMLPTNENSTYVEPIQEQQPPPPQSLSPQHTTTESAAVNENVMDAAAANTDPTATPSTAVDPAPVDDQNKNDTAESPTDKIEGDNKESNASKAKDGDGDGNDKNNDNGDNDDDENDDSTSQLRELRREEEIDPNQCRVCMTNANLLDIFRIGERTSFRICDLIMKLAPSVKISERDYLPHSICGVCVDRIEAAYELRIQCEKSDELLRSKLKRSKKTTRRAPAEFLLVDATAESSESDDDQKSDDEEFKLSEASEESSESESSDSSYDEKKKRTTNQRGGGGFKRGGGAPLKRGGGPVIHQPMKKPRTAGVVYIKAVKSDDDGGATTARKPGPKSSKGPMKAGPNNRLAFRCDVCNRPCSSAETLAQHRRIHTDEKCGICSMVFKNKASLIQHMQRHKDDPDRVCKKCHRVFVTKAECQRHIQTAHAETVACQRCRRYFPNRTQLDAHRCMADRKTMDVKPRRTDVQTSSSGQDLFKSVAPVTTTYWSDSFSD